MLGDSGRTQTVNEPIRFRHRSWIFASEIARNRESRIEREPRFDLGSGVLKPAEMRQGGREDEMRHWEVSVALRLGDDEDAVFWLRRVGRRDRAASTAIRQCAVEIRAVSQKGRFLRERRGGGWNVAERSESVSQNSFSIPTSQKVAEP